jgi:uroporphyrinogen decarboxylase
MILALKNNMNKWIHDILNSLDRYALPLMAYPGLELTKGTMKDMANIGMEHFRCIKALAEKFPSVGAVTAMDLSLEAEAFGSKLVCLENEIPTISERIIADLKSAEELKTPEFGEGRIRAYIEALELASKNILDRPVFGSMIGPFSLTGILYGITETMIDLFIGPNTVNLVLEKATCFLIKYAKTIKNTGASGIIIAEPTAGLLSPAQNQEFSSNYVKKIVESVQDEYFMIILHNCGDTTQLVPAMLSTGAMGYHFGNIVDLKNILPQIPLERLAFGNIDPAGLLKDGETGDIINNTHTLLNETANYKNFVLSSGCDVPPGTPIKNIEAFFRALEVYNLKIPL